MSEAQSDCPPDLVLERQMAGDLPPGSPHAAHIEGCTRCAARLSAMRAEGEAYMQGDAAAALRRELVAKDGDRARRRRAVAWWSAAVPLAAAAAWIALVRTPPAGDLDAKGAATVELLVVHEGQAAPWSGGALPRGEAIELSWTGAEPRYVAVIGREDGGETVRWFPGEEGAALMPPGTRTFGDALRFDPPFAGTVYVLVGASPFSTGPLVTAIREGREPSFVGRTSKLSVPRGP